MTDIPAIVRRWWPLAAVAALLALAALAAAHSRPQLGGVNTAESRPPETVVDPSPSFETLPPETPPPSTVALPGWVAQLAGLVCVLLVVAAVVAGLVIAFRGRPGRRLPRDKAVPPDRAGPPGAAAHEVVAAVDAGLVALDDTDADPRRAVIACWVRLEEAAAFAGTRRHPSDTPTDLVTRLLADHAVDADVLAGFAAAYREARYATHTVDETMRDQARNALRRLRGELTAPVQGQP